MKLNRKGYTLIELLATIVIIALVVGLTTYGIISAVNSSKEKAKTLSISSIKDSALTYSGEASSESWKNANSENTYEAFCVTVGELMNKGLLDENAKIEGEIDENTFILVKRNKTTLVVEKTEIVSDIIDDENNQICTGQILTSAENYNRPKISGSVSYTDKIEISFTSGSATYNGSSSEVSYKCLYGENSSNINREGKIEGNKCILSNLKSNHNYYVIIYMNTNHGSSIAAEGERNYKTTDLNAPTISQSKNTATITYNDKDSSGNTINPVYHYFKSTLAGISNINVEKCEYSNNTFTCSDSTKTITKDVWYRVSNSTLTITYPEENNDGTVTARISDGSNNYVESEKNISIRKYTIKFYKGSATSIDGKTSSYIEKYCVTVGESTCSITSPSITAPTGYSAVGWNTSSSASSSSWNVSTAKNINTNANYYAIIKINTYTIRYNANGGSGAPSSQTKTHDVTLTLSTTKPTRTDYTFLGWSTSNTATSATYSAGGSYTANASATLYAVWKLNSTPINANKFVCEGERRLAVYYVLSCAGNDCTYSLKNGLNSSYSFTLDTTGIPTWSINKTTYSDSVSSVDSKCQKQYVYANTTVNCRDGASTSGTSVVESWSACTPIYVYRTTMKIDSDSNWFYSSTYGCYIYGDYISTSEPSSCSSGVGLCGACSSNSDCQYGTCTGTCTSSSGSYSCCVTSFSSQCN